mmetsp:Transcript_48449/g.58650  ORF Transcript_48449/g.58650 Transcript_48449/m.58650 type:complete len:129 (+) Transcript_48449:321-707(+)|eukprot:CAMPEP_0172510194 /NCGR_PEP_ID=MMETSP1066-20121228/226965_1 /TAXON_ID=671091 /ORGANISM="Coscinodiscus wailesii, Strain CCMP2513" /LENGTH=128 /DNA_ID=CAMNT_0013289061 /DNA_START=274 /DNA_END=660 /DNA_ORIENTATION=-
MASGNNNNSKSVNSERNYVSEAHNWEQRVKGEMEYARTWQQNWGELYAKNEPSDYSGRIAQLRKEMELLPVQSIMTNSQLSHGEIKPYKELGSGDYRRRSFEKMYEREILEQVLSSSETGGVELAKRG